MGYYRNKSTRQRRLPEGGLSFKEGLKFVLSDKAEIGRFFESEARPPALPFVGDILPPGRKLDEIPLPLLLPGAKGIRDASLSILALKQFTDAIAPKLDQNDELFALGLSDAATEFFGEEFGSLVKGESVISMKTAKLVIAALRSGAIGQTDALSPEAVKAVMNTVLNALSFVQGANSETSRRETELTEAIDNLDDDERARLNESPKS
eukprot:scaffold4582_cov98-Cylindrotheca_fusiformis.AAC.3